MAIVRSETGAHVLTPVEWLIVCIAAIGFLFDTYELLMLPLLVRPALAESDIDDVVAYLRSLQGGK